MSDGAVHRVLLTLRDIEYVPAPWIALWREIADQHRGEPLVNSAGRGRSRLPGDPRC
ncbi:hypothetical protein [Mycobacteroides abscessus]|uniref:hypothetical protein n=1 Tax=Mycobacteroides abscessus TaxID=36809 RepID=UPI0002E8695A|nr:hypothetical protein [Mycobacteroides abscessus]MDO3297418.1 hypothetical protein [Mycobacteroides abscessus subsp. massiliense]